MYNTNTIEKHRANRVAAIPAGIVEWMTELADRIRSVDFEGGRCLFSNSVFGYGTRASSYSSLDEWHHDQWVHVWPATTAFSFRLEGVRIAASESGSRSRIGSALRAISE